MPLKVVHQGKETVVEDGDTALIGSDASSEIRIVRPGISRRHAVVSFDGTEWKVEDAGSRNGTFIDGNRITVSIVDGSTTAFLGHPTDGEQVTFVPQEMTSAATSSEVDIEEFDLPASPPQGAGTAATAATAAATTKKVPAKTAAPVAATASASAPTRVQTAAPTAPPARPAAAQSASDVELAQLAAAIRDQIKAVKGLTWSVWAMIAVTAALIVLTLFVGILSN